MTTVPSGNRDGMPSSDRETDGEFFRKHDEYMRRFRLAHPEVETAGPSVRASDWLVFVPIKKVRLAKYSKN